MDRLAIFIDAGYFFAAGANAAFNKQIPRKQIALKSPKTMIEAVCDKAIDIVGGKVPILRVYWYDAMPGPRLSLEQTSIALLDGVKLRLGVLNSAREQKGVDSLIVTDIIDLARNKAIAEAVIVSGDEDLRIAVQVAQSFGVRVHILAAGDASKNVSISQRMEADSVHALDNDWFNEHLEILTTAIAAPADSVAPAIESTLHTMIEAFVEALTSQQLIDLEEHFKTNKIVPPEYDRPLIGKLATAANQKFSGDESRSIRGYFIKAVRAKQKPPA